MNAAHFHLLINHLPILLPIVALAILLIGLLQKNNSILKLAYLIFILAAISAMPASASGEEAEEQIEHLPGISHALIHEHEEAAEQLAIVLYLLGALSLVALWAISKNKPFYKLLTYIIVLLAIGSIYAAKQTGSTGGEISHPEIRTEQTTGSNSEAAEHEEQEH